MTTTHDIVHKLWNLCHVLRDDGVSYHDYVTELTFLLFLKMAKETGTVRGELVPQDPSDESARELLKRVREPGAPATM